MKNLVSIEKYKKKMLLNLVIHFNLFYSMKAGGSGNESFYEENRIFECKKKSY